MDLSTVLGLIGGVALIVLGVFATAVDPGVFLNWPGLVIVLGGTLAATLMSHPLRLVLHVFRVFFIVMSSERSFVQDDIDDIVWVSRLIFGGKLKKAEEELENIRSPFLRMGVGLIVDGAPIEDVLDLLQWRIHRLKAKERAEAQVFRTMAMYSPAFGMVGTLLGLVNMLFELADGSLENIGVNMALALITTFYGLIFANLIFRPIAMKFEGRTDRRIEILGIALEGISLMGQGRTPAHIRETLNSFIAQFQDEIGDDAARITLSENGGA